VLSVHSVLDVLGWKAGFMALIAAITISGWGFLSGLPGPVVFVIFLAAGVLVLFGMASWKVWKTVPSETQETVESVRAIPSTPQPQSRPIPPTEPILSFINSGSDGHISLHSDTGRSFWLHFLVLKNIQFSTVATAHNLVASLKYFYLGVHQFTDEGLWWSRRENGGSDFKRSVSIESGETARLVVVGEWPSEGEKTIYAISPDAEKVLKPKGDWRVEFSIQAQNCPGVNGLVIIKMLPRFIINAEVHAASVPVASAANKPTTS